MRGPRSRRPGQRGFTLIEVLIGITVISMLGGALAVAAGMGIRALGQGGANDRAGGAHDLSAFEQQVSADVSRSVCLAVGGSTYGACSHSVRPGSVIAQCQAGAAVLCAAWNQLSDSPPSCHLATYSRDAGGTVLRTEYLVSGGGVSRTAAHNVTSIDGVTIAVSVAAATPPSGVAWVSSVQVEVQSTGVRANAPAATVTGHDSLNLRPLAVDPGAQPETTRC